PGRDGWRECADSRAGRLFLLRRLEELALRRPARAWHGVGEVLYAHQGRDLTLAAPGHARPRISYADTRMKTYCAVAAAALAFSAWAQAPSPDQYPAKPIRLIVPLTPGSGADIAGRIIGQRLNEHWKQPVIVENRPGAGGQIGTAAVVKAEPDGYTLLVQSSSHAANPAIYKSLPYDPVKDLADVAILG